VKEDVTGETGGEDAPTRRRTIGDGELLEEDEPPGEDVCLGEGKPDRHPPARALQWQAGREFGRGGWVSPFHNSLNSWVELS
jgi:hypothetical protein